MAHETWIRISKPAEPPDRDRAHPGSATVGGRRPRSAAGLRRRPRRADVGHDADDGRDRDDHDADRDRGLLPELEREELDEPLRRRVEVIGAGREQDLVEDLEERVERDEREDAQTHDHGDQPERALPDGPPGGGPVLPADRREQQHDHRDDGRDRQSRRTRCARRACARARARSGPGHPRPRRRSRAARRPGPRGSRPWRSAGRPRCSRSTPAPGRDPARSRPRPASGTG